MFHLLFSLLICSSRSTGQDSSSIIIVIHFFSPSQFCFIMAELEGHTQKRLKTCSAQRASELIVRVGGEEVAGSVAVKTPIDKLGTVIKTINDLKSPYGVALNQAGEIIVVEYDAGIVSIFSPTGDKLGTLDT